MGMSARELNRIESRCGCEIRPFRGNRKTVPVTEVGELRLSSERQARMAWLDSERSRDSTAKMTGGQPEMGENLGNDPGLFDGGNDLQLPTTVRAMFHVDIEHPFEEQDGAFTRQDGIPHPLYFLAVASNAPLPGLGPSFYQGDVVERSQAVGGLRRCP